MFGQPIVRVTDPQGRVWDLSLRTEMVSTADLKEAIRRAGADPKASHRPFSSRYGVGGYFRVSRWALDHSNAFILVADTDGPPPSHKMLISPAIKRRAAKSDLLKLAEMIQRGEAP